jgi:hypothetical protein
MDAFYDKMSRRGKRQLYDEGTDDSLEKLLRWNQIDAAVQKPRLLNQLMDERKPFHETILPDKTGEQPTLVAPPPVAPQPKPLRSVLVR